jgi:hypothetical protein
VPLLRHRSLAGDRLGVVKPRCALRQRRGTTSRHNVCYQYWLGALRRRIEARWLGHSWQRASSLRLAMGLTTILTTIWVCPPKSVTVQNPYLQGNRTSVDVLGRAADAWGSRGREFKSRQPDQYTPPHPTWSDLHSTDILKAGCPNSMTSASQPVASRKVAVMITPPRGKHESFLPAAPAANRTSVGRSRSMIEKCAGWHTTNMYGAGARATSALTRPG